MTSPPLDPAPMTWSRLRAATVGEAAGLRVPMPAGRGCCVVCRGPAGEAYPHCFSCDRHRRIAPGLLADAVVPLSYSLKNTDYSRWLRNYKNPDVSDRDEARAALRPLLLVFLHDHGRCLWASAGIAGPSHVALVPSSAARPGRHPLRALVEPYLTLPWAGLTACAGDPVQDRTLRVGRYRADESLRGASVLLLDDTWASGASAQSAAAALKLAGATSVVTVVLGRHVDTERLRPRAFIRALSASYFRLDRCAVHDAAASRVGAFSVDHHTPAHPARLHGA